MVNVFRERWGTFSVRDHTSSFTRAPFVSDVLLYDRLIIPTPPSDGSRDKFWARYEPETLAHRLEILKVKTDDHDGLAIPVPWGAEQEARFKNRMSKAAAVATQNRDPEKTYYNDPFDITRELIRQEFLPKTPRGVTKAWPVAAYSSGRAFHEDQRGIRLAAQVRQRFLTPIEDDPNGQLLRRAVDLVTTDDFRRKRAKYYEWQETIIEEDISDEKAMEELEIRLAGFNAAISNGFAEVAEKFAYTVIPIAAGLVGSLYAGGDMVPMVVGGVGGLATLTRFARFERKPVIDDGDLDAAAMIHDAREVLPLAGN